MNLRICNKFIFQFKKKISSDLKVWKWHFQNFNFQIAEIFFDSQIENFLKIPNVKFSKRSTAAREIGNFFFFFFWCAALSSHTGATTSRDRDSKIIGRSRQECFDKREKLTVMTTVVTTVDAPRSEGQLWKKIAFRASFCLEIYLFFRSSIWSHRQRTRSNATLRRCVDRNVQSRGGSNC